VRRVWRVKVGVRDTGLGSTESERPHLFDRSWQAHPTTRLGKGLGLFIARSVVASHGGTPLHSATAQAATGTDNS